MPLPIISNEQHLSSRPLSTVKTILAIAAGKGGVGKSSVTVNLGLALKALGYQVGVLDADIYGPSIRQMLPEEHLPTQKEAIIEPAQCFGMKMISMAYFRKENEAIAVRAPIANGLISHFIKNVNWGNLDVLLVDFPPGTGDIQLTLSQQASLTGAIMVTTPQEVALLDVRKAMSLFEQVKIPILGVVENMSYYRVSQDSEPLYPFGRGGGKRLASESEIAFLGEIPLDPLISRCGDEGKSLFLEDPELCRPSTQAFMSLASKVIAESIGLKENTGLGSFELQWKEMQ